MSGVLAALLKGKDLATAVQWGAAHGILVQETAGDITMVDERAVLAEVKRALAGSGVGAPGGEPGHSLKCSLGGQAAVPVPST